METYQMTNGCDIVPSSRDYCGGYRIEIFDILFYNLGQPGKRMKRKSPLFEKFARIFLAYEGRKHFSMLFRVLFNILTRVSFHVFHLPNHRIRVCETARITQMAPAPLVFIQQI